MRTPSTCRSATFSFQPPPHEPLPIPDFRTHDGRGVRRASPDLLDMLYACQERQGWYRDFALTTRLPEAAFVGSASLREGPEDVAARMARALGFDLAARAACRTWEEALRLFIGQADGIGVLVMVSGVVLSNNRRTLDPEEFRGFALADKRAPLVFINGADTKSGQMFTLAHELAHLWLGGFGGFGRSAAPLSGYRREEVWCNAVAAELLVPLAALRPALRPDEALEQSLARLARQFKVSTLVVLRRLLDAGALDRTSLRSRLGKRTRAPARAWPVPARAVAISIARRSRASAGGLRVRLSKARSKGRRCIATPSACSAFRRRRRSTTSAAKRGC